MRRCSFDIHPRLLDRSSRAATEPPLFGKPETRTSWGRMYACAVSPSPMWPAPGSPWSPNRRCPSRTLPWMTLAAPTNPATNGLAGLL